MTAAHVASPLRPLLMFPLYMPKPLVLSALLPSGSLPCSMGLAPYHALPQAVPVDVGDWKPQQYTLQCVQGLVALGPFSVCLHAAGLTC